MFLIAGAMAVLMRVQLAVPNNNFMSLENYNQLFTMHGSIMLFLFLGPFAFGTANYLVPLQIGAPDMAFPRFNAFSYWLFLGGCITMNSGFLTSSGAADWGWLAYAPQPKRSTRRASAVTYGSWAWPWPGSPASSPP